MAFQARSSLHFEKIFQRKTSPDEIISALCRSTDSCTVCGGDSNLVARSPLGQVPNYRIPLGSLRPLDLIILILEFFAVSIAVRRGCLLL